MRISKQLQIITLVVALILAPVCRADMVLSLEREFVKKYRDKATISTIFNVDALPKSRSAHQVGEGAEDGDIHMAGRDTVIQVPLVAEIINARMEKEAMDFIKRLTLGQAVDLTGVWRIWFEHLGQQPHIQGDPFPTPSSSNIAHAFELHPVTVFNSFNCLDSFLPIVNKNTSPVKKFKAYDTDKAFTLYEKLRIEIANDGSKIALRAGLGQLNYAEFVMELAGKPKVVTDGLIVPAKVYEVGEGDAPRVARNRRMIFAKGSPPADEVRNLVKGDRLRVIGIPRVNLNKVYSIAQSLAPNEKYLGPLPYEMIIVAVIPEE